MKNPTKNRRLQWYGYGGICIGLLKFLSEMYEYYFVYACFGHYQWERFIDMVTILLAIAGILVIRRSNFAKPLFLFIAFVLMLDAGNRLFFHFHAFPLIVIVLQFLFGLGIYFVARDKVLVFED